ncbi:MAG: EAL domain-containing protein, partial [Myxococcota bacterium]
MDQFQQVALTLALGTLIIALAMSFRPGHRAPASSGSGARIVREGGMAVLAGGFVSLLALAIVPLSRFPGFEPLRAALPTAPPDLATAACAVLVLLLLCAERGRWAGHEIATVVAVLVPWFLIPEWGGADAVRLPIELLGLLSAALYRVSLSSGRSAHLATVARETAVEATGDGVLLADPEGRLIDANASGRVAFEALSTRPKDPETGRAVRERRLPKHVRELMRSPEAQHFNVRLESDRVYELWLGAAHARRSSDGARALIVRDVSEKLRDERRLMRLAHYDSLTGLANRRLFIERLENAVADAMGQGATVALLYVDLDRFKEINDTLGHGAGDEMLRVIAGRFQKQVTSTYPPRLRGPEAAFVARLGGDEFAVVIPDPEDAKATEGFATQLLTALAEPIPVMDRQIAGSASVGIAMHPEDGLDVETLVKHADSALYGAKRLGRNRYERYKPEFSREAERKRQIEEKLRAAIEADEFELHYQPKVDLASSRVGGFEALVRWHDDELGRVGPDEFIPIAEERGLISEIGAWCLNEACRQQRAWCDAGLDPVAVAVNVSSAQFVGSNLPKLVRAAINRHAIQPGWLELELTERLLLEDSEQTTACLSEIQSLGVSIALDDFGTGYSALTYLNRFPLDVVKMDRGLLENVETSESAEGIAAAVVSMCHSIGMKVVAEGVESEGQLEILREMSCDQIQGYLYAPALRPDDASRFLTAPGVDRPIVAPKPPAPPVNVRAAARAKAQVEPTVESGSKAAGAQSAGSSVTPHVLIVDDTGELQQSFVPRLQALGIKVFDMTAAALTERYILPPDDHFHLVVTNPQSDVRLAQEIVEVAASPLTDHEPALVFVGEEPDEEQRDAIRAAGARMVLWSPFSDSELRFLVRSVVPFATSGDPRDEARIPLDSMAWIRFRSRREVGILSSLSRRGAFIEMMDPLDAGLSCKVEFELPSGRFTTFGKVIYCHREGDSLANGIGVEFYG